MQRGISQGDGRRGSRGEIGAGSQGQLVSLAAMATADAVMVAGAAMPGAIASRGLGWRAQRGRGALLAGHGELRRLVPL